MRFKKPNWSVVAGSWLGRLSRLTLAGLGLAAGTGAGMAASATFDFTTDPTAANSGLTVVGSNEAPWQSSGGNPGGFLAITYSENSKYTGVVFPDIDSGKVVSAFKFDCDLRVGNPNGNGGRPADGFSISFARGSDPLLGSLPDSVASTGNFAGGIPEGGSTTGIAVSFDTWSGNVLPDGPDIEGIIVRVDNKTILRQPLPTRNGACDDVTSLQTGSYTQDYFDNGGDPRDPLAWKNLCWQPFSVEMDNTAKLTVKYKGKAILDKYQTSYFPSVGRLIMAGRTGGANENTHVDNIRLVTETITDNTPPTAPSNLAGSAVHARRIRLNWTAGKDDSGKLAYEVERDGVVLPDLITATTFAEASAPNTSHSYRVRSVDPALNRSAFTTAVTVKTPVEKPVFTAGVVKFEAYKDITGTPVDNLVSSDKFTAGTPDEVIFLGAIDTPNGYAENYGAKVSGFIAPKESGNYRFFLRSDDASQLFLSKDETEANAVMIAEETACCNAFTEPDSPRTSDPIALAAGKRYAFYAYLKEGGGGDYLQVAWRKDGDTTAAAALRPISGDLIGAIIDPNQGKPIIVKQPVSASIAMGGTATFSVESLGTQPFTYQWLFRGQPIAGATSKTYTVASASGASTGGYSVVVTNEEGSTTTGEGRLTVTGVPTTLFVHATSGPNDSDKAAMAFVESLGWQVIAMGAATTTTADATGKALIVISSTVSSGEVGDKFKSVTTPVFNWEAALQDNFDESDRANDADGTTRGVTGGQTQINIVKAGHALSAGYPAGLLTISSSGVDLSWGVVGAGATIIATIADNPDRAVIYAHDKGATLFDGSKAAGTRVHFPGGDNTFAGLNDAGKKLFEAGVIYAAGGRPAAAVTPKVSISSAGGKVVVTYAGTLESATSVKGPFAPVAGATSPLTVTTGDAARFYRAKQ